MAIAAMTGVAAGAPTTIPFLLTQSQDVEIFRFAESAKVEGEEKVDGQLCFKITAHPKEETTSWWIDKETFLLRRIFSSYDEKQSAAKLAESEKAAAEYFKKAGQAAPPKIEIRLVSDVENFQIEAINSPIDEKLFATPTK